MMSIEITEGARLRMDRALKAMRDNIVELEKTIITIPRNSDQDMNDKANALDMKVGELKQAMRELTIIDFVERDLADLELVQVAREQLENDPSKELYEGTLWFHDQEDTTTAIEVHECLFAADSAEQIEAELEYYQEILCVDPELFPALDSPVKIS